MLGAQAPNISVFDCDSYIERKFSSTGSSLHVYFKGGKVDVVYPIVEGKRERNRMRDYFCTNFLLRSRFAKECAKHITTPLSHRHIPFEFTNKSAKKLVVKPATTVGFGFCSVALNDESFFFF